MWIVIGQCIHNKDYNLKTLKNNLNYKIFYVISSIVGVFLTLCIVHMDEIIIPIVLLAIIFVNDCIIFIFIKNIRNKNRFG